MKKLILAIAILAVYTLPAYAQLSAMPNTFVSGTTIVASEVNANFTAVKNEALNRTGGTMTGNLLFSLDNTRDIGASGATRPRRGYFGTELIAPLFTGGNFSGAAGTFTGDVTAANLVLTTGGITGVSSFTASGTITGNLFSGSGASLTSIPESGITDGAILARVGGSETITGAWSFSNAGTAITVSTGATSLQAVSGTTGNFSGTMTANEFSGSGASLTSVPETAITDGSVLARVGGNETISGTWTFSNNVTVPSGVLWSGKEMDVFHFGGDWREYTNDTSYPAGNDMSKTIAGTGVWYVEGSQFPGTYRLEGICKSDTGTPTVNVAIKNLATDVTLTGGEATVSASTVGDRFVTGAFTFAAGINWYFVKVKTSANFVSCWGIRVMRLS